MIEVAVVLARFSPDRQYRYLLSRDLGFPGDGSVMFIMLNPSTADKHQNDPTIRRCISFGKAWSFKTLYVTNLFQASGREYPTRGGDTDIRYYLDVDDRRAEEAVRFQSAIALNPADPPDEGGG